jgi:hypothetical protein
VEDGVLERTNRSRDFSLGTAFHYVIEPGSAGRGNYLAEMKFRPSLMFKFNCPFTDTIDYHHPASNHTAQQRKLPLTIGVAAPGFGKARIAEPGLK